VQYIYFVGRLCVDTLSSHTAVVINENDEVCALCVCAVAVDMWIHTYVLEGVTPAPCCVLCGCG